MKKILLKTLILVTMCMSFTSFAADFKACDMNSSSKDFCDCFIENCEKILPSGSCTTSQIQQSIRSQGVSSVCRMEVPNHFSDCVDATNYYVSNNSPCH